jgi:hypothetical protein
VKPVQSVFNFNNIKILNMSGNSSFNIGEISNKEFSSSNNIKGLNSAIGDHSDSHSIMKISSFDEVEEDQAKEKDPSESEHYTTI